MALVLIITTVATQRDAKTLARGLIKNRLAACVQITGPLESHFEWKAKPTRAREWQIQIKTMAAKTKAVEKFMTSFHPYEVPEFLVMKVHSTSQNYLAWVRTVGQP